VRVGECVLWEGRMADEVVILLQLSSAAFSMPGWFQAFGALVVDWLNAERTIRGRARRESDLTS
jgi:hypothetical protein